VRKLRDVERVASQWDRQASPDFRRDFSRRSWTGIAEIHLNHNFRVSGDRNVYWITWLKDKYFQDRSAGDALSLGCGDGHLDRIFKNCGFDFRSLTGIDVSPKSIERAREQMAVTQPAPTVNYLVRDLNSEPLPAGPFDFIYFFQSLHHIEQLEFVLRQCAQVLKPGGLLMVNEFVGPSRFQWTAVQKAMATTLINLLPAEIRVDLLHQDGRLKESVVAPTVEEMAYGDDPSEAVRSGDIESVLASYFEVIEQKNWGGTLNYLVFENIAGNFDTSNPYHRTIVELLIHHENVLIDAGILPSDFRVLLARPRGQN
jgi:SAM-dependent methyltransferase